MTDQSFFLNNRKISLEKVEKGLVKGKSEFEKSTLEFCRQWLSGQNIFNLETSGSTGAAKTIEVKRKHMVASAEQTISFFNLKPGDTVVVCLSTAYVAGKMMLVRALEGGMNIIANEPTSHPLLELEQDFDFLAVVPLQMEHIIANPFSLLKIQNAKATIVGGAPVSYSLSKAIEKTKANVFATFGMTETLSHFALRRLSPKIEKTFRTMENVLIAQDDRGCLVVSAPQTGNQPLPTNDLVTLINDQEFQWLGRIDNVVNSGGYKIQLEEVEAQIESCFYDLGLSNRFFLFGTSDEHLGERLEMVVENLDSGTHELDTFLRDRLRKFERPKKIHNIPIFKETPTGKIDRQATIERLEFLE